MNMNKRLLMTLKLYTISSPMKRADYLRKKGVFHHIGERVMITPRKIPLYPNLISIGNNVWMASGVGFVTHDVTHYMLNGLNDGHKYQEKIGCIEIGSNVFIGSNCQILYDVKIGDNVIIAAGAVVARDVPPNSVVGGVPTRIIGSFDDFVKKRREFQMKYPADNMHQIVSPDCESEMWERFSKVHSSN